ncbi:MAG: hypothetical protein MI923_04730 [Phycisphaerales bacterium]|nr:hypothetical protein [Phycisphaerales bacterium]
MNRRPSFHLSSSSCGPPHRDRREPSAKPLDQGIRLGFTAFLAELRNLRNAKRPIFGHTIPLLSRQPLVYRIMSPSTIDDRFHQPKCR